ncbi:MAG: FAD-dependent oxidoreductase, partial [Pirellulales bacterium]
GLLRKNKVTRYAGHGRLTGAGKLVVEQQGQETQLKAEHIVIASGSVTAWLPGVERGSPLIGGSTAALDYDRVPETMIVIGGGYIGLELGSVWNRLGSKVTVLEYLDRLLPGMDHELAAEAQRTFSRQGLDFRLSCRVTAARVENDQCVVEVADQEPLRADRVLVAVGRVPYTKDLGLETVGIKPDAKGRIEVDEHWATSAAGVYAIGDVIGGVMLAHKAEEEGVACVERIVTGYGHVNYNAIPAVVFTEPEIATVGRTEDELKAQGVEYRVGKFPFKANARARTLGHTEGFVKVLADAGTDRVLGVHIIGPRAGELIAEATAAIEFGASSEDIARTCHAHPTLPEALKEAALAVSRRTIHI